MIDPEREGGPHPGSGLPGAVLLDWEVNDTPEAITVALRGEVDMVTAPRVRTVLTEVLTGVITPGRTVVVDTTGLRFCGASGLGVLLEARHRARTRRAQLRVVIAPGSHLARVWSRIGLARVLPPYPDRDAATAAGASLPAGPQPHRRSATGFVDPGSGRALTWRVLDGGRS